MEQCVITGAVRTAVGAYLGGLKTVPAYQLGSQVLDEVVKRGGVEKSEVEQVIMGDVLSKTPNLALIGCFWSRIISKYRRKSCPSSLLLN